jgi:hypothetical protein
MEILPPYSRRASRFGVDTPFADRMLGQLFAKRLPGRHNGGFNELQSSRSRHNAPARRPNLTATILYLSQA